jgi:hypothetical protein
MYATLSTPLLVDPTRALTYRYCPIGKPPVTEHWTVPDPEIRAAVTVVPKKLKLIAISFVPDAKVKNASAKPGLTNASNRRKSYNGSKGGERLHGPMSSNPVSMTIDPVRASPELLEF